MFILSINNHRVFLIQFEIDLKLIFQKAEIELTEVAYAISVFFLFEKTHLCKLIPNSGLLVLCNGAISHNRPQIASEHTIHEKSHNS